MFPNFVVVVTKSSHFTIVNGTYQTAVAVPENTVLEYACADTEEQAAGIANALVNKHRCSLVTKTFGDGAVTVQSAIYPAAVAEKSK